MSSSVLEKKYLDTTRPYSQKELSFMRKKSFRQHRVGKVPIEHTECGHFYLAKINGRKEREALESGTKSVGNCSVCWKISRTPRRLKKNARQLVDDFGNNLYETPSYWTYEIVELESDFYTWLYDEFNPDNSDNSRQDNDGRPYRQRQNNDNRPRRQNNQRRPRNRPRKEHQEPVNPPSQEETSSDANIAFTTEDFPALS
jgi:hypothetical protein